MSWTANLRLLREQQRRFDGLGRFVTVARMNLRMQQSPIAAHFGKIGPALVLVLLCISCVHETRTDSRRESPRPARTISLPNLRRTRPDVGVPGRVDHLAYDPATRRLFVTALENGSLEVLDLESGKRVQSILGLSLPQGAAVIPKRNCVAVACGGDGVLHVYDTWSLKEHHAIEVGPDADNVRYDARTETVWVSYGSTNSGAIAVFDPDTWKRIREFSFGSRPESFQLEPRGDRLFANLPKGVRAVEDGSVAVVNRTQGKTEALIALPGRARNFPMAFDAAHERLFIASRRPARLIVIDTRNCVVLGEVPCTDDSDDLFYDTKTGHVLVIGGGFRPDLQEPGTASPCSPSGERGALDVFEVESEGQLKRLCTIPTAIHARTGLFVPSRRAIYIAVPFRGEREAEIQEYQLD
jgi:hypothetical protein